MPTNSDQPVMTAKTNDFLTTRDEAVALQGMVRCVCGSTLFRRCYRTGGWWKQIVESNKNGGVSVVDTDVDSVRNHREPKTMECTGCGKRVANPDAST